MTLTLRLLGWSRAVSLPALLVLLAVLNGLKVTWARHSDLHQVTGFGRVGAVLDGLLVKAPTPVSVGACVTLDEPACLQIVSRLRTPITPQCLVPCRCSPKPRGPPTQPPSLLPTHPPPSTDVVAGESRSGRQPPPTRSSHRSTRPPTCPPIHRTGPCSSRMV